MTLDIWAFSRELSHKMARSGLLRAQGKSPVALRATTVKAVLKDVPVAARPARYNVKREKKKK